MVPKGFLHLMFVKQLIRAIKGLLVIRAHLWSHFIGLVARLVVASRQSLTMLIIKKMPTKSLAESKQPQQSLQMDLSRARAQNHNDVSNL